MSKEEGTKKISRKETQKIVFEKLSGALEEYKSGLKKKKLVTNLKKISKLFAADIVKAATKQNGKAKKLKKKAEKDKQVQTSQP